MKMLSLQVAGKLGIFVKIIQATKYAMSLIVNIINEECSGVVVLGKLFTVIHSVTCVREDGTRI